MRSIINFFIIILMSAFILTCGGNEQKHNFTTYQSIAKDTFNENLNDTNDIDDTDTTINSLKSLGEEDFSVSDSKNSIQLDIPFFSLNIDTPKKTDENMSSHIYFVSYVYSGVYVYKVYTQEYYDITIYISNYNYNFKGRDFDDYFITQITLVNSNFKTYRGITVGSTVQEVYSKYGYTKESIEDDRTSLRYTLGEMMISFQIDNNQKVEAVILSIIPGVS